MSEQEIIVTVTAEGRTHVEASGFTGGSCEDATRAVEQALGAAGDREYKPEYELEAELQHITQ